MFAAEVGSGVRIELCVGVRLSMGMEVEVKLEPNVLLGLGLTLGLEWSAHLLLGLGSVLSVIKSPSCLLISLPIQFHLRPMVPSPCFLLLPVPLVSPISPAPLPVESPEAVILGFAVQQ